MKPLFYKFLPASWRKKLLQQVLTRMSAQYIEGTAEGGQILRRVYPSHLYDPLRRAMAVELGGKEIAKILDAENNKRLSQIRTSVENMYEEREGVYAPVHDFWSFVEMVLHIKKKELPELITAANVHWSIEDIPLKELSMTWMPFLEQNETTFGKKPWEVAKLLRLFSESPSLLEQAKQDQIKLVGEQQHKFEQSEEPITIVNRGNGYELIDGNGRLYRAVLSKQDTIKCYVGNMKGPAPVDYWVSSGGLKQFCLEIRGYQTMGNKAFDTGISYLKTKLGNNATALINYELYLRDDFPEFEEMLNDVLPARPTTH